MKRLDGFLKKNGFAVHPVFFALFPLLSFYGSNISEIRAQDFQLSKFLIFNLAVGVFFWSISLVTTRSRQKASVLTLVILVLFFIFGRIHNQMGGFSINTPLTPVGPTKILLISSVLIVVIAWYVLRKAELKRLEKINATLTIISIAMIISALVPIATTFGVIGKRVDSQQHVLSGDVAGDKSKQLPDIYYILLDGYARDDYLRQNFNYDNTPFINSLKESGFYVADKANSNYAHTHFSVPSTLNMKYLNYLADELGEGSEDRTPLRELTQNNEVVSNFKELGYKYVNIGTRWPWTATSPDADIDIPSPVQTSSSFLNLPIDEFAMVYLQTTAIKPWVAKEIRGDWVSKILAAFEKTEKVASLDEPTLTLTHILSPHPPYLFDRNGVLKKDAKLEQHNSGFSNRISFVEQTMYINKLTLNMVNSILKNSDNEPIIIIASDHGPASSISKEEFAESDPNNLDVEGIRERMGILNAYLFPDKNYTRLYPSITPINSFRLILSQYFDRDLELLPDYNYFSDNAHNEYRMLEVTDYIK